MDCPECGSFNSMLDETCGECGQRLPRPGEEPPALKPKKKSRKRRARERQEAELAAVRDHQRRHHLTIGALWLGGGLLVTLISYSAAAPGGSYIVTTGAIAVGFIRLMRGLAA
jgi:hypothetical protein